MADNNSSISKVNVCPKCNADVEPGLKFCTSCGSKVEVSVNGGEGSICSNCFADVGPGLKFCTSCGSKVEVAGVSSQETVCSNCFADVEPGLKFCTSCGSKVEVVVSGGEGNICSNCFADVERGLKFCTSCGTKTESIVSETVCPECYADVKPNLKFCTECGTSLIESEKLTTSNQISQKLREKRVKEGKINPPEDEIFESIKESGNGLMKGLGGFMSKATGELDKVLNQPTKSSKRRRIPDINPGYLVCDTCEGYYELQKGEKPNDFMDECECGGKYIHKMRL